jgi:predicted HD phosphohydrolase
MGIRETSQGVTTSSVPVTRMDQATIEDWGAISETVDRWQSLVPERIRALLLQLQEQPAGFGVNQLQHSLQTATRALRAGASEEVIVAALCHDIGTAVSIENHSAIAAEILKPYVSPAVYDVVRSHQDFQRAHYGATTGRDVEARRQYLNKPWFALACRFSDEWDQTSFDPNYDSLSLDDFQPMIERVFGARRNLASSSASSRPAGWKRYRDWIIRRISPA